MSEEQKETENVSLGILSIDAHGYFTIPPEIMKKFNIDEYSKFEIIIEDDQVTLRQIAPF